MRSAPQNPAVLGLDLLFGRAHRLIVDADPSLAGQPAGLALAAREPSLDKELRNGALAPGNRLLLRPGVAKRAALVAVGIGRGPGMELVDEALSEPLLDVLRVRAVTQSPRILSDLGRGGIGRQLQVTEDQ